MILILRKHHASITSDISHVTTKNKHVYIFIVAKLDNDDS